MNLARIDRLKPAVVVAIYLCGYIPSDGTSVDTVIVGIECSERTCYVHDSLPTSSGSPIHRLACAVAGNVVFALTVVLEELLGRAVLVELVHTETLSTLRRAKPFPCAPPIVAAATDGAVKRGKYSATPATAFRAPPTSSSEPIHWSVKQLDQPILPPTIPRIVRELTKSSCEWRALLKKRWVRDLVKKAEARPVWAANLHRALQSRAAQKATIGPAYATREQSERALRKLQVRATDP